MPIITLTTDLGIKDHYVAAVKGAILSNCEGSTIVDISHQVSKFDISEAAFILRNAFPAFPGGTIHIAAVMPERNAEKEHLAILYEGHYFIGADNGIFPFVFEKNPEKIVILNNGHAGSAVCAVKDVFVKAACHIAKGGSLEEIGSVTNKLYRFTGLRAVITENSIRGTVIYIDDFGNVFVNITEQLFHQTGRERNFILSLRAGGHTIDQISNSYSDVPAGEMLAFFSSSGFLELAINLGNASDLLGIKLNDIILIEFED